MSNCTDVLHDSLTLQVRELLRRGYIRLGLITAGERTLQEFVNLETGDHLTVVQPG